ncbi:FixH family protein [Chitinophaga japonensis]|uniref:FixH family protein n=1 Tax=Chitinophaga japonensis TaxID=104662 RepID=UPI0011A3CF40
MEFRSARDNQPVDVGKVEVRAEMAMPGMPMVNDAQVEATDTPGRYAVRYNLSMSGTWTLNIKFDTDKSSRISLRVS